MKDLRLQEWRLLDYGPADAYMNMAIDEALLLAQEEENLPPTLRFYTWRPAAVSLGYAQDAESAVNRKLCLQAGIDVVRRSTGGRAVYHESELTYALAVRAANPLFSANVKESYATISKGLLAGLKNLGLEAQFASPRHIQRKQTDVRQKNICFLSPSWYEIMVEGRKLIGSAQRRLRGTILQQGSIPLKNNDKFLEICNFPDAQTDLMRSVWAQKTAGLWDYIEPLPLDKVKEALIRGFEETLPVKLIPGEFSALEKSLTRELEIKYRSPQWNNRNR